MNNLNLPPFSSAQNKKRRAKRQRLLLREEEEESSKAQIKAGARLDCCIKAKVEKKVNKFCKVSRYCYSFI